MMGHGRFDRFRKGNGTIDIRPCRRCPQDQEKYEQDGGFLHGFQAKAINELINLRVYLKLIISKHLHEEGPASEEAGPVIAGG
jgi:hypothetical protein